MQAQNSAYGLLKSTPRPFYRDITRSHAIPFLFHSIQMYSPVFRFIAVKCAVTVRMSEPGPEALVLRVYGLPINRMEGSPALVVLMLQPSIVKKMEKKIVSSQEIISEVILLEDAFAHLKLDEGYRALQRADDAHLVTAERSCSRVRRA